jgi:hypothetical protein
MKIELRHVTIIETNNCKEEDGVIKEKKESKPRAKKD